MGTTKEYYRQIGIDRISRLVALRQSIINKQVSMLIDTSKDNHSAKNTFKFKVMETLIVWIGWKIDITRFFYFELIGELSKKKGSQ